MGHFRNISHNAGTADILTNRKGCPGFGLIKLRRINNLPQGHRSNRTVWNLNADNGYLPRNSSDPDTGCSQAERNIIGAGSKLIQAYTLVQLHLIPGNTGATSHIDNMGVNPEACQGFIQPPGIFPHFLRTIGSSPGRLFKQINGRETVWSKLLILIAGNFPGNLFCGSICLFGGNLFLILLFWGGFKFFFLHKFSLLFKRRDVQLRHFRGSR